MGRSSRKDEILQAALACFSEHGVDATTIEMIRDRSGASIGSLYHHFGNKERIHGELYLAGIGQYAALLESRLRQGAQRRGNGQVAGHQLYRLGRGES
ncbi:transcriptional regulator [Pseudomonas aeruginosa]|nr:transcriptional regulator [Pseudomonas aeruginosa]